MTKKTVSQSLLESVRKLDKINDIEVNLEGDLEEIIDDPELWAERQAERILFDNVENYLEAKELGEEFWDEIRDRS